MCQLKCVKTFFGEKFSSKKDFWQFFSFFSCETFFQLLIFVNSFKLNSHEEKNCDEIFLEKQISGDKEFLVKNTNI